MYKCEAIDPGGFEVSLELDIGPVQNYRLKCIGPFGNRRRTGFSGFGKVTREFVCSAQAGFGSTGAAEPHTEIAFVYVS